MLGQMNAFNAELLEKAGVWVSGEGLGPSAASRTLRFGEDGEVVADRRPVRGDEGAGRGVLDPRVQGHGRG